MTTRPARGRRMPPPATHEQPLAEQLGTDNPQEQAQRVYALRQMAQVIPTVMVLQYDPRTGEMLISPLGQARDMSAHEVQRFLLLAQEKLVQLIETQTTAHAPDVPEPPPPTQESL